MPTDTWGQKSNFWVDSLFSGYSAPGPCEGQRPVADLVTLQVVSGGLLPEVGLVTPTAVESLLLTDAVTGAGDQMGDGVLTATFPRKEDQSITIDGQMWALDAQDWILSVVHNGEQWERISLAGDPASQLPSHSDLSPSVGWACYLALAILVVGAMGRRRRP